MTDYYRTNKCASFIDRQLWWLAAVPAILALIRVRIVTVLVYS